MSVYIWRNNKQFCFFSTCAWVGAEYSDLKRHTELGTHHLISGGGGGAGKKYNKKFVATKVRKKSLLEMWPEKKLL